MNKYAAALAIVCSLLFTPRLFAADEPRDPTQPLGHVAHKAAQAKLELQAVFFRGQKNQAVINGRHLRVGDEVEGAHIVAIDKKSVVYRRNGETRRLTLRDSVLMRK